MRSVGVRWYTCSVLCELRVENLLLIERAELALAPGLNVLTGETGAGKTVLAGALDLLMGGRSRAGIVRPGFPEAYVEGVFSVPAVRRAELADLLPESVRGEDDPRELVLARRVFADGRTRAYLNGRSATVGDLRELGARLISFYGQHEHRKLVLASAQRQMLDGVCGEEHVERLAACAVSYGETVRLESELERLRELGEARERELGLLEHELAEIDAAQPDEDEHTALTARRDRLRRIDALRTGAGLAADALAPESSSEGPGVAHLVAGAASSLEALAGVDLELDALAERCKALSIETQDLAGGLRGYCEGIAGEDGSLEHVEEKLALLDRVMRKHGGTISSVLEYAERSRARREELLGAGVARDGARELLAAERRILEDHVERLRAQRKGVAALLAERVRDELAALAMGEATFEIAVTPVEVGASGGDAVEFVIAPNPGVAGAPLREIASGGELSRVMLALTSASSEGEQADGSACSTLVFDEIDAGIGGHTARAVGERLQTLAHGRQVICITHIPQIASLAARHFSVAKDTSVDPTVATVVQLEEGDVVTELVRMLGAEDDDDAARGHARELRRAA